MAGDWLPNSWRAFLPDVANMAIRRLMKYNRHHRHGSGESSCDDDAIGITCRVFMVIGDDANRDDAPDTHIIDEAHASWQQARLHIFGERHVLLYVMLVILLRYLV